MRFPNCTGNEQHLESSTPFTCFYELKSKSIVEINQDYKSIHHAQKTNNTVDLANCSHCFHTVDFACCHHFGSMTTHIKTQKNEIKNRTFLKNLH